MVKGITIEFLAADRSTLLEEDLGPAVLIVQPLGMSIGLLESTFLSIQRGLERARIDEKEAIVLSDLLTVVEVNTLQVTGNTARTSTV